MPPTAVTRVLLLTEGTYPFVDGGVSTWCDQILASLPEVAFTVYAVTGDVQARLRYRPPEGTEVIQVPLWGVEHPAEWGLPLEGAASAVRRRLRVRGELARSFAALFEAFLGDLAEPERDPVAAGRRLARMHDFFMAHDFPAAMGAPQTWAAFQRAAARSPWAREATAEDLTTCLRWLRALLMPLALPVPVADVSHATISGIAAFPGVIARITRGTPLLLTEHGVALRERYLAVSSDEDLTVTQKRFMLAIAELAASVVYRHADHIAPVCRFNARWEHRLGASAQRVDPIWNGIDPSLFTPRDVPPTSPGFGRPTAVAAARVFPLKDVETMIRAAARARDAIPDVLFLLYGSLTADVPYVRRCQALVAELGLQETFVMAGLAPEPTEIFNQGDIGVLSSVSEAFPYTVLEALACGRPVAATDVGGVREMLEGWGELVPARDHAALGDACVRLLSDSRRRVTLGRRGRERVLSRFRAAMVADRYRALYRDLTASAVAA